MIDKCYVAGKFHAFRTYVFQPGSVDFVSCFISGKALLFVFQILHSVKKHKLSCKFTYNSNDSRHY